VNGVTQPNQFFDGQWSSLYAWRTIGNSAYHSAQFMIRHRRTYGLEFDFNYTLSKSTDVGSNAERINEFEGFGLGSQIINTWQPTSEGILTGAATKTGRFIDKEGDPNVFQNGPNASNAFRIAFPGESGQRNNLRGPGFLNTDMSLTKQWKITESQNLKFSWEV